MAHIFIQANPLLKNDELGLKSKFGLEYVFPELPMMSVFEDGQYQEPEFLPDEINHLRGAHPFIAPDESYLIFDAQPDGMGKSQLFVSFRTEAGGWTRARPFDSTINATDTENIPYVSPDGKYFFFHRTNDIYWVDAAVIARLR